MAKNRLTDWDTTAGNNTDVGGINIAEGWAPENVNNAARETMSQLAEFHGDITGKLTSAGAAGAYTLTTNDGVAAYAAGQLYMFIANHANTGAATLNVNAIGAKSIVKRHDVALEANDIEANQLVLVAYEATDDTFQMISQASVTELSIITTRGDLIRGDSAGAAERYAVGTVGQVLASDGTDAAWGSAVTSDTAQTATGVETSLDFTSIPAWVTNIMIPFAGLSLSGTNNTLVQIGDAGGLETTGYVSTGTALSGTGSSTVNSTSGFIINTSSASHAIGGNMHLVNITGNTWIASFVGTISTLSTVQTGGTKTLTAALDRLSIVPSGVNTFDAGSVNILYW